MRAAQLLVLAAIAGCAPDYGHSAFLCQADGDCPDGQILRAGRCRRGEPTGDGVLCGEGSAQMRCAPDQQCCWPDDGAPRCGPADEPCAGTAALCDGKLDCHGKDLCCGDGDVMFCDASCRSYVCRSEDDCPLAAPNCCQTGDTPWKTCSALSC